VKEIQKNYCTKINPHRDLAVRPEKSVRLQGKTLLRMDVVVVFVTNPLDG
jgi:hypothetical protein